MVNRTVRPFSAGYFILDADIFEHPRHDVIIPTDYFEELSHHTPYPLLRLGTEHHWAHPERGLPHNAVVVPEDGPDVSEDDPVLMAKPETAQRLISAGEQERPKV